MDKIPPVAILGSGIAGLTAAIALRDAGIPVDVYEANSRVAGMATSFKDVDGFSYDFGAHFITNRFAHAIGLASKCRDVRYYGESVLLTRKTYSYPFGLVRVPRFAFSAVRTKLLRQGSTSQRKSVAEVFSLQYGEALAREVAIPLVEAWSGEPAANLSPAVADKIPNNLLHVLALKLFSICTQRATAIGYCKEKSATWRVWHVYPVGGLSAICRHLADQLADCIHLESPVEEICVKSGEIEAIRLKRRKVSVSAVVSTAPVTHLSKLVSGSSALNHLSRFRYRAMVFVNMKFRGRALLPDVVLWTPDRDLPFFRLTEAPVSMPWLAPQGKTMITADIGCVPGDATWSMSDSSLGELCVNAMNAITPGVHRAYIGCSVLRTPFAYPVFLNEYEEERCQFQKTTGVRGLYSIGRNGEFDHLLTEDVYWRTLRKVPQIIDFVAQKIETQHVDLGYATA
jgi:protoporphyrinogen/coproporphyrinogen III oxidase